MGITRQLIFGIAPKDGAAFTLSYAAIPDGNADTKAFSCALVPSTRGAGVSLAQNTVFLGTVGANLTFQTLRSDKDMDQATAITGTLVTNRIDPDSRPDSQQGRARTTKRFRKIAFEGFAPSRTGIDVTYAKDLDPILDASSIAYAAFEDGADDTELEFNEGLAEWVHIMITESGNNAGEIILSNFDVEYYTVGRRPGGDS